MLSLRPGLLHVGRQLRAVLCAVRQLQHDRHNLHVLSYRNVHQRQHLHQQLPIGPIPFKFGPSVSRMPSALRHVHQRLGMRELRGFFAGTRGHILRQLVQRRPLSRRPESMSCLRLAVYGMHRSGSVSVHCMHCGLRSQRHNLHCNERLHSQQRLRFRRSLLPLPLELQRLHGWSYQRLYWMRECVARQASRQMPSVLRCGLCAATRNSRVCRVPCAVRNVRIALGARLQVVRARPIPFGDRVSECVPQRLLCQ